MPSGPVRKPEIERPGLNGSVAVSAPWKISSRLPSGSANTIRSLTRRSSASARAPRATCTPAFSSRAANRIERGGVRDLPAEEADALAAVLADDDALLAVVHAQREALARSCRRAACRGTWCRSSSSPRATWRERRHIRDLECPWAASVMARCCAEYGLSARSWQIPARRENRQENRQETRSIDAVRETMRSARSIAPAGCPSALAVAAMLLRCASTAAANSAVPPGSSCWPVAASRGPMLGSAATACTSAAIRSAVPGGRFFGPNNPINPSSASAG